VRPDQEFLLREVEGFALAWKKSKWAVPRELIPQLPYVRRSGWKQKAQSFRELQAILGPANDRIVSDVGAGTGWLSYRLTEIGFRCFATDLSSDSDVGLDAAREFDRTPNHFERAIATLDCWPFRSGVIDIAICNASLHYLADIRRAISEAARVLGNAGVFIIMNTPVHRDSVSASRASLTFRNRLMRLGASGQLVEDHQHFVESELENRLRDQFAQVIRHNPQQGAWFTTNRAIKGAIVGVELAAFPVYEARLPRKSSALPE
jgi:ubiquinone/menaquinone biosynthesis C-methylase UbiE